MIISPWVSEKLVESNYECVNSMAHGPISDSPFKYGKMHKVCFHCFAIYWGNFVSCLISFMKCERLKIDSVNGSFFSSKWKITIAISDLKERVSWINLLKKLFNTGSCNSDWKISVHGHT